MNGFRTVLEAELNARGLTQADVRRRARLSKGMVSLLVAGKRKPSMATATTIAEILERPVDGLFDRTADEQQTPRPVVTAGAERG